MVKNEKRSTRKKISIRFISDFDADEHKAEGDTVGRPAWMIHVQHTTDAWLKSLPKVDWCLFVIDFI